MLRSWIKSIRVAINEIKRMSLGEEFGVPHERLNGPDGRVLPAPWLLDEFPELAGAELPPPLDYLCDNPESPFVDVIKRLRDTLKRNVFLRLGFWITAFVYVMFIAGIFWPDRQVREGCLLFVILSLAGLSAGSGFYYLFKISRKMRWRHPGMLVYAREHHIFHDVYMTPITAREFFIAQWVRIAMKKPGKLSERGSLHARHRQSKWENKRDILSLIVFIAVLSLFLWSITRDWRWTFKINILVFWGGWTLLSFFSSFFAGASAISLFQIPDALIKDNSPRSLFSIAWWKSWFANFINESGWAMKRVIVTLYFVAPYGFLVFVYVTILVNVLRSWLFYPVVLGEGLFFLYLSRSKSVLNGQRWARWMVRGSLKRFESKFERLRETQLRKFHTGRAMPRVK